MANGIRTGNPCGFNKGRCSKFREEGQRTYRPKRCGNNNKDEDNSLKILNDKNSLGYQKPWQFILQKDFFESYFYFESCKKRNIGID